MKRVVPGNPDASYLVRKIEGTPGITPVQMPQGCPNDSGIGTLGAPCLKMDEMHMFRTWINACAPNN